MICIHGGRHMLTFLDANTDGDHRYLLFSATFPKRLKKLAAKFLDNDHVHISIGRTGSVHVNVKQQVCIPTRPVLATFH